MTAPDDLTARAPASDTRRRQTLQDAVERGAGGTFIFVPVWLLIGWVAGLHASWPAAYWFNAGALLLYAVCRFKITARIKAGADSPRDEALFTAALLLNALHWGVLTAASAVTPQLKDAQLALYLTSVGIAGAGSMNLAILKPLRIGYPLCVLAPLMLTLLVFDARSNVFEIVALMLYMGYVRHVTNIGHDDYHRAAAAVAELEDRARQLELLSTTDALTGIHNRHLFDHRLVTEWSRAAREGTALSMLLIDVDHFKRVNDSFGHPVGDRCLIAVAQALQGALARGTDVLARYGGEEFAVLLPGSGIEAAEQIAHRLRRSVEAIEMTHEGVHIPLAVSIGVAVARTRFASSAMHAMQEADLALYSAKREGRNRVVVAEAAIS